MAQKVSGKVLDSPDPGVIIRPGPTAYNQTQIIWFGVATGSQVEVAVDFFGAYASFIQSDSSGVVDENSLVDAATSLHAAGQWAMLLDVRRAADLFAASARI